MLINKYRMIPKRYKYITLYFIYYRHKNKTPLLNKYTVTKKNYVTIWDDLKLKNWMEIQINFNTT